VNAFAPSFAALPPAYFSRPIPPDPAWKPRARFAGVVQNIADGDTIDVLADDAAHRSYETHGRQRIRFYAVDAPESKQEFGETARDALRTLIQNTRVVVEVTEVDQYGRTVGRILRESDGLDVNLEMVARGCAWHYKEYAKRQAPTHRAAYAAAEAEARAARRGLWVLPNPQYPRDWRRAHPR
jgi:endonuclease YncB( thermonuclease family)